MRHPYWNNLNLAIGWSYNAHLKAEGYDSVTASAIRRLAGTDIKTPINTVIRADKKCKVQMIRLYSNPYKNFIRLQYSDRFVELGHILSPKVKEGQILQPGTEIARTGASGRWLHVALLIGKSLPTAKRVNPEPYLKAWKPPEPPPAPKPAPVVVKVTPPKPVSEPSSTKVPVEENPARKNESTSEEVRGLESRKYTLGREDLIKILKGLGIALLGALLTYLESEIANIEFGDLNLVVASLNSVLVNAGRKFISGVRE